MTNFQQNDNGRQRVDGMGAAADEAGQPSQDRGEPGALDAGVGQPAQEALSARSAAIVAAIGELGATLHASSLYNAKLPRDVRKVAANILIKVIDLILGLYPEHPEWVIPLNQLLYGLKDLDRGQPNSLFEPVKLDNRPPNTIADVSSARFRRRR